jgi:mannose-1-phosphate guanylyltransferase
VGEVAKEASTGDEFEIPPHSLHRAQGGPEGLQLLEIALGNFDEGDIVRVEDDYGRTARPEP